MQKRKATIRRTTRETDSQITLDVDGTGKSKISTGLPFLDHMLELLARHSLVDLTIAATGDLAVDYHHTVEDIGLALGTAIDQALGSRKGIVRYGWACIPMDDARCQVAVDLGGRPYLVKEMVCRRRRLLDFELSLFDDFFQALTVQARMNLHIDQTRGEEAHHAFEAVFKALARALRMACTRDPRDRRIPSSKGTI